MPLRQLALWMKLVRPLVLSRDASGRLASRNTKRRPRPNAPRERPKPERVARLPSVAGQERAAEVSFRFSPPLARGERPTETRALAVGLALPAVHISDVRAQ